MASPMPDLPDPDDLLSDDDQVDPGDELALLGVDGPVGPDDLAGLLADTGDDDVVAWRITSDAQAEWAMRKLADARANGRALRRQLTGYVDRVQDWHQKAAAPVRRDESFFEAHLMLWAFEQRAFSGGAIKTSLLPSGEIRTRKPGPWKPTIEDPAALLAWALDARDRGTNIVRSQLLLDVLVTALQSIAVVVADDNGDMVVVEQATGERIPGTAGRRSVPAPSVITYESD